MIETNGTNKLTKFQYELKKQHIFKTTYTIKFIQMSSEIVVS